MKKSILAGTLATVTISASALTIDMTSMVFGSNFAVSGTIDSTSMGDSFSGTFFNVPLIVVTQKFFDISGNNTWSGPSDQGDFSYNFILSATEIAFGTSFNWSVSRIPVLVIMDCGDQSIGAACVGRGTPMQVGPFPGEAPAFNGVVSVPVPAAAWLMCSGLLGLAGITRHRKIAETVKVTVNG